MTGKMTLVWEIHDGGEVKNARVDEIKSTLKNDRLRACLVTVMSAIRFPAPPSGTIADVSYPFLFAGKSPTEQAH